MGNGAGVHGHVVQSTMPLNVNPGNAQLGHQPPIMQPDYRHPLPRPRGIDRPTIGQHDNATVVVAIDFGMTFTGYAFAFMHDPNKVYTCSKKLGDDRVPTTVLLKDDETFHSFGYQAEEDYLKFVKAGNHKNWRYYERFKMALYTKNDKIKRDSPVYDRENRPMAAILLFTMVIFHLKTTIEKDVSSEKNGALTSKDFKWLLTIPAIWSDSAKQFMREAALNAGISSDRLHLVLEPEAASVYCIDQAAQWQRHYFGKKGEQAEFKPGFKYILADLGGGTADICVHEILEREELREIYWATGGALGGTCVNNEFVKFWRKLVGAPVVKIFEENMPEQYLELMKSFERKKKHFSKQNDDKKDIKFSLDPSFVKLIADQTGEGLKDIIPNTNYADKVRFNPGNNSLTITGPVVETFFSESIRGIIKRLKEILSETNDKDVKTLILVGGYSESPYLREMIQSELDQLTVLEDKDARLAVLKGAVLSGFQPRTIQERRSRFTYGFHMTEPFDSKKHPDNLKVFSNNAFFCDKVFVKQIEKGAVLRFGRAFKYISRNYLQMEGKFSPFKVHIVRSTKKDPKFCTEDDECSTVGTIDVLPPRHGWRDVTNLELSVCVGETEFIVNVCEYDTQTVHEAEISFL